ncbi:unnamed protein product [Macrosiphum euphorbiae]|uniref:Uncharacterized protein n=1 Tax=Macrosiphum euphorbiae TaxID=13131 RepID=A0AAV0WZ59_9HEMI|nr:unnamed protein product [Macrosiphum euphorbiae]
MLRCFCGFVDVPRRPQPGRYLTERHRRALLSIRLAPPRVDRIPHITIPETAAEHTYLAYRSTVIKWAVPPGRDLSIAPWDGLTPASIPNVDTSGAQFLVFGTAYALSLEL